MATEYAHIVKSRPLLSKRFVAWCGARFETSRSAGWLATTCPACKRAKRGGR